MIEFFALLRSDQVITIPSVSDENLRIVYDAYSQALPVIASATPGLRDSVKDHHTGRLVPRNDATALADMIEWAGRHPEQLERLGFQALEIARSMTHQAMHRKRWALIRDLLDRWGGAGCPALAG